jgi:hypothetical protein
LPLSCIPSCLTLTIETSFTAAATLPPVCSELKRTYARPFSTLSFLTRQTGARSDPWMPSHAGFKQRPAATVVAR